MARTQIQSIWNSPEMSMMVAFRMGGYAEERRVRADLERLGVRAYGCNMKLAKGIPEENLVDFFMAIYRRQAYQEEYAVYKKYVDYRRECLQSGDKSVHPMIYANVDMYHSDGYSQNAIAEDSSLSQAAVNRRVIDYPQKGYKYGQIIETLPHLSMLNLYKYIIDEDNETTGLYLTKEQRQYIKFLKDKGYTQKMIHVETGFSPRAIARWYKANIQ